MVKKWITFDLDGTLMQNPFAKWVFPEMDQLVMRNSGVTIRHQLFEEHRKRMRDGLLVAAYDWDDIVAEVLTRHELNVEIDVEILVRKHAVPPKVYLLETDILETLQSLRREGFSLAAVTNGFFKYQKPVMDVLGLSPLFDLVITPDEVGCGKPQIEMVDCLQDDRNQIIAHVGDRIDHDVVLANELGIISVFINRGMDGASMRVQPFERAKLEECVTYYKQKWCEETGEELSLFPIDGVPDMVVCSLTELIDYL